MAGDSSLKYDHLHRRAMELVGKEPSQFDDRDYWDAHRLLHELEVYKIEVQMQMEELDQRHEQFEDRKRKYDELADLHNRMINHLMKDDRFAIPTLGKPG